MLTVVTFFWRGGRTWYTPDHVNVLRRMVGRHLSMPHRFICATNTPAGIDGSITVVPMRQDLVALGNAYPKLEVFRPDAAEVYGDRILLLDLDLVIMGSLDALVDRSDSLVVWRDPMADRSERALYNTSMLLLSAGTFPEVWETFDAATSPTTVKAEGWLGSDQAWLARTMGEGLPVWTEADGVLSWRFDLAARGLAPHARVVAFHGRQKPEHLQGIDWIRDNWR